VGKSGTHAVDVKVQTREEACVKKEAEKGVAGDHSRAKGKERAEDKKRLHLRSKRGNHEAWNDKVGNSLNREPLTWVRRIMGFGVKHAVNLKLRTHGGKVRGRRSLPLGR